MSELYHKFNNWSTKTIFIRINFDKGTQLVFYNCFDWRFRNSYLCTVAYWFKADTERVCGRGIDSFSLGIGIFRDILLETEPFCCDKALWISFLSAIRHNFDFVLESDETTMRFSFLPSIGHSFEFAPESDNDDFAWTKFISSIAFLNFVFLDFNDDGDETLRFFSVNHALNEFRGYEDWIYIEHIDWIEHIPRILTMFDHQKILFCIDCLPQPKLYLAMLDILSIYQNKLLQLENFELLRCRVPFIEFFVLWTLINKKIIHYSTKSISLWKYRIFFSFW